MEYQIRVGSIRVGGLPGYRLANLECKGRGIVTVGSRRFVKCPARRGGRRVAYSDGQKYACDNRDHDWALDFESFGRQEG